MNEAERKKEEGVDTRNGCGKVTNPPTTKRPRKAEPKSTGLNAVFDNSMCEILKTPIRSEGSG